MGHGDWALGYSEAAAGRRREGLRRERLRQPARHCWSPACKPLLREILLLTQAAVEHVAERCASLRTVGGRVLAGLQRCRRGAQRHSPSSPTHTAHCRPQLPLLPLQMGTGETTNHRGKPTVFLRLPRTSCQPFAQPSTQGAGCSKPCGQGWRGCGCEPVRFAHWGHGDWPPCF